MTFEYDNVFVSLTANESNNHKAILLGKKRMYDSKKNNYFKVECRIPRLIANHVEILKKEEKDKNIDSSNNTSNYKIRCRILKKSAYSFYAQIYSIKIKGCIRIKCITWKKRLRQEAEIIKGCDFRSNLYERQVLVFEEMRQSFETMKAKRKSLQASLFESPRISHVKCLHIIEPSLKQIYFVHNLDRVPHYSIYFKDMANFVVKCEEHLLENKIYKGYRSYVKNNWMTVINFNTNEWTKEIDEIFNSIKFRNLKKNLNNIAKNEPRNNLQICAGFSTQSYSEYTKSDISRPMLLKDTKNPIILDTMDRLSKLCDQLYDEKYFDSIPFNNKERNKTFSYSILESNRLEGFTVASNSSNNELLACHVDKHNCTISDYNGVIAASQYDGTSRVVTLGYGRRSCSEYFERKKRIVSVGLEKMTLFYENVSNINMNVFDEECKPYVNIKKQFNKDISLSCQIWFADYLEIYDFNRFIELLSIFIFAKDSIQQYNIFCYWKTSGYLKRHNHFNLLELYYVSTLIPRYSDSTIDRISSEQILSIQARIKIAVLFANQGYSYTRTRNILIKSNEYNERRENKCNDLIHVLVLAGIIRRYDWISCKSILPGSFLHKKLCENALITSIDHCNQVIRQFAKAIDRPFCYTQNVMHDYFCEESKNNLYEAFDIVFPNQLIYFFENDIPCAYYGDRIIIKNMRQWWKYN